MDGSYGSRQLHNNSFLHVQLQLTICLPRRHYDGDLHRDRCCEQHDHRVFRCRHFRQRKPGDLRHTDQHFRQHGFWFVFGSCFLDSTHCCGQLPRCGLNLFTRSRRHVPCGCDHGDLLRHGRCNGNPQCGIGQLHGDGFGRRRSSCFYPKPYSCIEQFRFCLDYSE